MVSSSGLVSDDEEAEHALDVRRLYAVPVSATSLGQKEPLKPVLQASRHKEPVVSVCHYDPDRQRLYYGLDNGAVCFWPITQQACNTSRFVGAHKGPVTAIALGKAGLIVTGSVDFAIKIWDYHGKVILDPTVCVQTLHGHAGTVTALVVLGDYLISSSTDNTIKVWRQEEGRGQLVYPWYELQVRRWGRGGGQGGHGKGVIAAGGWGGGGAGRRGGAGLGGGEKIGLHWKRG